MGNEAEATGVASGGECNVAHNCDELTRPANVDISGEILGTQSADHHDDCVFHISIRMDCSFRCLTPCVGVKLSNVPELIFMYLRAKLPYGTRNALFISASTQLAMGARMAAVVRHMPI